MRFISHDLPCILRHCFGGYIKPVLQKEWNARAAAGWGFESRKQIEALLNK
jgi:hypothetical protein